MNLEKTRHILIQFIKFGIVGLTNTAVSYLFNILTIYLLSKTGVSWDYIAGNVVGFITGTIWSFFLNDRFVFNEKKDPDENKGKILIKTFLVYGFTIILVSNVLSYVWINIFGISKYIAPVINLCISVPLNFILNKYWAFRR
ncbi:MAG: GtrA family protein [Lachnospiraceae bacterium]|nr:GtrA family protein [Lachnospiraceae bacterium]